jgi:hypothetical protein
MSRYKRGVGTFCIRVFFFFLLSHSLFPLKLHNLMHAAMRLKRLHGIALVLLRWVSVAEHHLNAGVSGIAASVTKLLPFIAVRVAHVWQR